MVRIMEESNNLNPTFNPKIPDPAKPELMEDPRPVGIYIDDAEAFLSNYYVGDGDGAVIGLLVNSQHIDTSKTFLEYLFRKFRLLINH